MNLPSQQELIDRCYALSCKGYEEGGVPVALLLARGGYVGAEAWNRRVQLGDPVAHGEMDCLRRAGHQRSYRDTILYTPCMMCAGIIVQFGIPAILPLRTGISATKTS